jgi:hypothetical protein
MLAFLFADDDFRGLDAFRVDQTSEKFAGANPGNLDDFGFAAVERGGILIVTAARGVALKHSERKRSAAFQNCRVRAVQILG